MRRTFFLLLVAAATYVSSAQDRGEYGYIMDFLGAGSEDEAGQYEVERLQDYLERPLDLNASGMSRLMESGLLTQYQTASLLQYRKESGNVLSLAELAALDGFGKDFVERLAPFVSLKSPHAPGHVPDGGRRWDNDLAVRSGCRFTGGEGLMWNYGAKYRVESGNGFGASLAYTRPYDSSESGTGLVSGSISYFSERHSARVVIGDFNARFGQGLALWNGMMVSGLSSVSSFSRNASGISRSWSFTGTSSLTGIAGSWQTGRVTVSSLVSFPDIKTGKGASGGRKIVPAMNVAWYGRSSQLSVTNVMSFSGLASPEPRIPDFVTSVDMKVSLRGTDVFAEAAYDWVNALPAVLAGTEFPVAEALRMAFLFRYYPPDFSSSLGAAPSSGGRTSNELGISFAGDFQAGGYVHLNGSEGFGSSVRRHSGGFSLDAVVFPRPKSGLAARSCQLKIVANWKIMLSDAFRLSLRLNERYRNWETEKHRTDVRADVSFISGHCLANLRLNAVKSRGLGLLAYAEAGYQGGKLTAYLRQGVFVIDDWKDRIYAYERDAPGSFSVPAYYGRGVWTALTCSWRYAVWGRLYARASLLSYPFMPDEKKKPGRAELKLQMVFSF